MLEVKPRENRNGYQADKNQKLDVVVHFEAIGKVPMGSECLRRYLRLVIRWVTMVSATPIKTGENNSAYLAKASQSIKLPAFSDLKS